MKNQLSNIVFIIFINDNDDFTFALWAGILRLYNLLQFNQNSLLISKKALENELYDEIDMNLGVKEHFSKEWEIIYNDVIDNSVKDFVKKLSKDSKIPLPTVGEDLVNKQGVIVAEAELLWSEYNMALILEDNNLKLDGIKIFTLNNLEELKNELLKRVV